MNTQLVNSIVQVVRSLSEDEQTALLAVLNRLIQPSATPHVDRPNPATVEPNSDSRSVQPAVADATADKPGRHIPVSSNSITTVPSSEEVPSQPTKAVTVDEGWAIWESLGDDAVSGTLDNTSVYHDRYLYADSQ